jgi:3-deoxy-D-manno-octulosonic-acid transferase
MKFDDAPVTRETPEVEACAEWAGVDPWHRVWIFGSTQPGEEQMALDIYKELRSEHEDLRLILVPRHRERFREVADLIRRAELKPHRRSTDPSQADSRWGSETVLLIDTIGELRDWWGVGQIATVGGSFGDRGGQNMLEPAGYGLAVSFGPNTRNFEQIAQWLIDNEGAVRVSGPAELRAFVKRCLTDIPAADALGRQAQQVVEQHRGAIGRTIKAMFGDQQSSRRAA